LGSEEPIESYVVAFIRKQGKLDDADPAHARRLGEESDDPILRLLGHLGPVPERDIAQAFAQVLNLPLVDPSDFPQTPVAPDLFTPRFLEDTGVLPLRDSETELVVAVANPANAFVPKALAMAAGNKPVTCTIGLPSEIKTAIERLYRQKDEATGEDGFTAAIGGVSEDDIEHLKDLASAAPMIRLINQVIQRAVESRASDIHIEPFADELKVRYRIDGILKEIDSPPPSSTAAVISRVKIMSKPNIAEHRLTRMDASHCGYREKSWISGYPRCRSCSVKVSSCVCSTRKVRASISMPWASMAHPGSGSAPSLAGPTASSWSPGPRVAARAPPSTRH